MIGQSFVYALRGLVHRKLRSWLTMLGIFIGIAAVVALVSLSQGLKQAITDQFAKIGADKIIISAKGSIGSTVESDAARITTSDKQRVQRVQGIKEVASILQKAALISLTNENVPLGVSTLPDDATQSLIVETEALEIGQGRFFNRDELNKIVIGDNLASTSVLKRPVRLRDHLLINGKSFDVVGILKHTGSPDSDQAIIMNEKEMRTLFEIPTDFEGALVARLDKGADLQKVQDAVSRTLRQAHGVKEGQEDFDVQTPEDILASFNTVLGIVQAVLVGIAAISLLVGGIGIMNTMYTAVLERTNEIGVMKAIGARNNDVLELFLIESGLLGMLGGAIGVVLGMGTSKLVEIVAQIVVGSPLIRAAFPWYLLVGALAFAFIIGIASGVLPAYQAARLPPVEALRYE
jgi:putative ABC transport system permease protein